MTAPATLPAIPDPAGASIEALADACTALAERVAEVRDIPTAVDLLARTSAIEQYLAKRQGETGPAQTAARLLEARVGELLGPGEMGPPKSDRDRTYRDVAEDDRRLFRLLAAWRKAWETKLPCSRAEALRLARAAQREHTPAQLGDEADVETERCRLLHGDFRDRLLELEPGSVDLILTDPPYPAEDLPLWSDLGKIAAHLLGPRGRLAAYTGQMFRPEAEDGLREHLTYGWTYALIFETGARARIMGRHVMQAWKPVVVYDTGTWPSGEWHDDLIVSAVPPTKDEYRWQQAVAPATALIERLCPPNGLVVDPFLGVGTFGLAAGFSGRRFVGVEMDAKRYESAVASIGAMSFGRGDDIDQPGDAA